MSGILIIVINIVIILIFRRLDKENLRINKIKRFAEKAVEDIDRHIQTRRQEISDTTIELEILLKRSQAILADLEKKWETASIRQNEFMSKEEKLREMEQSLKLLNQMASRTNESIAFLKKDMITLEETRHEMAGLSGKVHILEKELTEKVKSSLAASHTLVADMQKACQEKIGSAEENFKVNIRHHLEGLTSSIAGLELKFQDIRKKHIDTISRDLVSFRSEISQIKKQYSTLEKDLLDKTASRTVHLEKSIETMHASLAEKENAVLQEARSRVEEIKSSLADFEARLKGKEEEVLHELERRITDATVTLKNVGDKVDLIDEKVNEKTKLKLDIFDKNLVNKLSALEEFIRTTEGRLLKSVQADVENVNQKIVKFSEDLSQKESEIMLNFNSSLAGINNTFRELNKKAALNESASLDGSKKRIGQFSEEIEKKLSAVTDRVNGLARDFDSELKKKGETVAESIALLRNNCAEAEKKLLKLYNSRLEKFNGAVNSMEEKIRKEQEKNVESVRELVAGFDNQISKRMGQIEELIGKREGVIIENSEARIKKLTAQIESFEKRLTIEGSRLLSGQFSKITALGERIDRIQGQIEEFLKQTRVFNDISRLRTQLAADFKNYESFIQKLRKEKGSFLKTEKEITGFLRFANELKNSFNELKGRQKDVDRLIGRIDSLEMLSKEVDLRIDTINSDRTIVKEVEEKITLINGEYKKLDLELAGLHKKDKTIKDISSSVNSAVTRIEDINKRFQLYDRDMENLNKKNERLSRYIKETEEKVLLISRNEEKIEDALSKFEEIDALRLDIDTRVKQLQKMREALLGQQTEMEKLIREADSRITNIVTVLENMRSPGAEKAAPAPEEDRRSPRDDKTKTILRLHSQGWSASEISRSVNLSESEVQFIIQLNK